MILPTKASIAQTAVVDWLCWFRNIYEKRNGGGLSERQHESNGCAKG